MILTGLAVGAALGIVMQRGRFCVTGMLRDIFLLHSWRTFVGLLIVIAVHAVGLAALTSLGVIAPEYSTFAPIAVVLGGLIFGLGIVLAGGCASGTWYRSGEGLVGSWFALGTYALSAAMMKSGVLAPLNDTLKVWNTGLTTLPELFGVSAWPFAIAFALLTIAATAYFVRREAAAPKPSHLGNTPAWKRPLHVYTAGAIIGLLGVIAWPLSAATGRNNGLGITTPSGNIASGLVTGNTEKFDWGVMLVLGILVGSFVAAKASGEFRLRVPDSVTAVRAIIGGILMGVGAALAGGCTVGNGMVETSLFSFQGWVALLFIALGVGLGTKLWLKPAATQPGGTYSTAESIRVHEKPADAPETAETTGTAEAVGGLQPSAPITPVNVGLMERAPSTKARPTGDGTYVLDTLGAVCPFPLIEAKDMMATLNSGDQLVIDFDCTQATESIPQWAADDGHSVTDFHAVGDARWQITVQKG